MIRTRLDKWCEKGILLLVLAIMIFGPLATGAVLPEQFLVIEGLTIGVAVLWFARLWINPEPQMFWPPVSWGVAVFVIYALARYQQADIEYVARQELIRVLVYAVVFFAIVNNLRRIEYTQIITFALMMLALALSFFAVYQFVSHYDKVWQFVKPAGYLNRGSGTYINPNHFGGFLEMILPLGLACALIGRLGHIARIVLGYGAAALLIGIGVSGSRGAWIATGLTLLVFVAVLLSRPHFRLPVILAMAVILGAAGYFFSRFGAPTLRLEQSFVNGQWIDARRDIWQTAWQMWRDHRWFGVGPGHFDYRFSQYRRPLAVLQMEPLYVHNDYLNALTDWGLVGALIIAATWLLLYSRVFKSWRAFRRSVPDARSNRRAVLIGAGCGLCAILIHSFTDFNLQVPANAILMVVLIALLAAHSRAGENESRFPLRRTGRTLAAIMLLGGLCYLSWQEWRKANECVWRQRAEAAKRRQNLMEARLALERAFTVEPRNFGTAYEIGEILRAQSWEGNNDYQSLAESAMTWFQRALALNPHDAYSSARMGMCLDWIGKSGAAGAYFEQAYKLDPNGYYMLALQGWHRVQLGKYADARDWFERSLEVLNRWHNPIAWSYLEIVNRKLKESSAPESSGSRSAK